MEEPSSRQRSSRGGYSLVQGADIDRAWDPDSDAVDVLEGVCDIHVHATGGRVSGIGLAKQATRAGMRALVFKNQYFPSVDAARLTAEVVACWAERCAPPLSSVEIHGGLVLNSSVGGFNPEAVRSAAAFGARKVWFPTYSSAAHQVRNGEMTKGEAIQREELSYALDGDRLVPEAREIIAIAAEHGMVVSVGHAFLEEIWAIVEETQRQGTYVIIDHPHMGSQDVSLSDQVKLTAAGAFLNHMAANQLGLWGGLDASVLAGDIRAVGVEHCILSTDAGQITSPAPTEFMRAFIRQMESSGFSHEELDTMTRKNPVKVLRLDER